MCVHKFLGKYPFAKIKIKHSSSALSSSHRGSPDCRLENFAMKPRGKEREGVAKRGGGVRVRGIASAGPEDSSQWKKTIWSLDFATTR